MELHPFHGELAVAQPHDDAVVCPGAGLEACGKIPHHQRVVAGGREGIRDAAEDGESVVVDVGGLAVDGELAPRHHGAEGLADRLMAKAHPQDGDHACEAAHQADADAGLVGGTRSGRHHDVRGFALQDLLHRDRVVAVDGDVAGGYLPQVLHQVVGEGIVVVEDQDVGLDAWLRTGDGRRLVRA